MLDAEPLREVATPLDLLPAHVCVVFYDQRALFRLQLLQTPIETIETLLPDALQAPIIVTFHMPADPRFRFDAFYEGLRARGYVIYPGKLTVADSFRIGCIGQLHEAEMRGALAAVREVLAELGVTQCGRARSAA